MVQIHIVMVLVCLHIGLLSMLVSAAPQPKIDPRQLLEGGDCQADEVLAWERLRAERRTVVEQDDSPPMACVDGSGRVYLITGSGKYLTSDDGGQNFTTAVPIQVGGKPVPEVQALGLLPSTEGPRLWLGRPRDSVLVVYGGGERLEVVRSHDDGQSWEAWGEVVVSGYEQLEAGSVRILGLGEGKLLLVVSGRKGGKGWEGLVVMSGDGGKTWSEWGKLGPRCVGANLLRLQSGELLAAIRYQGNWQEGDVDLEVGREEMYNHMVVASSRDGGRTWGDYQVVTRYKEGPGDLSELSDGTVVLTYGQQNFPYGSRAMLSKDGGKTWNSRTYILGYSTVWALWYDGYMKQTEPGWRTSCVRLKDDVILSFYTRGSLVLTQDMLVYPKVTTWYTKNGTPGEKGKAIMSVRWRPEGMNKAPLGVPPVVQVLARPNVDGYLDNGRSLIKPELLNEGGDYFHQDEIIAYRRIVATHAIVGHGAAAVVCLDPDGCPVVSVGQGSLYRSKDMGRTWQQIGAVPEGMTIESFGILRDGTMIISNGTAAASETFRSVDGGKTWSGPAPIVSKWFNSWGIGECVRINEMADGDILVTCSHSLRGESDWNGIYRSRDGGRTWGDFSYLNRPGCETNLLQLRSGKMLASIRYQQDAPMPDDFVRLDVFNTYRVDFLKNVAVAESNDGGYTWSRPRVVGRFNEAPGDLVELQDGRVVLSYQQKNAPSGARAMISRDQGKTWDDTVYMLGWWGGQGSGPFSSSGGHTSSAVMPDGEIVTVCNGWSPGDNSLITEATIWRPLSLGPRGKSDSDGDSANLNGKQLGWILNNDINNILYGTNGKNATPEEYKTAVLRMLEVKPGVLAQQVGEPDPVIYRTKVATTWDKYFVEVVTRVGTDDMPSPEEAPITPDCVRRLRELGTDPLQLTIEACRERGVLIVADFRMNAEDFYHGENELSDFGRQHKHMLIRGANCLDPAYPEVYAHRMAIFREVAENYDIDGIEFDFKRWWHMISDPHKNYQILTRMVAETRQMLDEVAKKKGRKKLILGARVSFSIAGQMDPNAGTPDVDFNCVDLGLDVATWVKQGYVDYLCPSYFHGRDLPCLPNVKDFVELTHGTGVGVYPTTFGRPKWPDKEKHPDNSASWQRHRDELCQAVLMMYEAGADGISTFNMGPHQYPPIGKSERGWGKKTLWPLTAETYNRGSRTYGWVLESFMGKLGNRQEIKNFIGQELHFQ